MTDELRREQADQCHGAQDWGGALAIYETLGDADPAVAVAAFHCRVELADDGALTRLTPPPSRGGASKALIELLPRVYERAIALCRARAFERASVLMRGVAAHESVIAEVYRDDIDPAARPLRPWWPEPTPFLTEGGAAARDPERAKAAFAGRKVLTVAPRMFENHALRSYEPVDTLMLSALHFGLEYRELDTLRFGQDRVALAAALDQALEDWRPDLVIVENLAVAAGMQKSAREPEGGFQAALLDLLRRARGRGARVVSEYADAWYLTNDQLYSGLGDTVDVVHHQHPVRLLSMSSAERSRVYCYPTPCFRPTPTFPPDSIPRFCFVGSVTTYNLPRAIWWAELGRRGAPVDFHESSHAALVQRSDEEYVNLLSAHRGAINFTRRRNGVPIFTGRTVETLAAGGLLLEEAGADTAYFLEPGTHYLPFATLADLETIMATLDGDPTRRTRVRADGKAWAKRWFAGDYFWTGLLETAFG